MGVILDHYGFPDILFERVASNNSGLGGISVIGLIDIVWLFTVYHFIEKRRAKKKKENIDGDAMMIAMYGLSALYGVIILSLFFTGGLSSLITE